VPAIAATLRIDGSADQPPLDGVVAALADRDTLLILDNLEQLDGAGSAVGELLAAAPRLRVLATSRLRLGTQGEIEIAVPALPLRHPTPPTRSRPHRRARSTHQLFVSGAARARSTLPF
jgi:predicted ATPase